MVSAKKVQSEKKSKKRRPSHDVEEAIKKDTVIPMNAEEPIPSGENTENLAFDDNEPTMEERLVMTETKSIEKDESSKKPSMDKELGSVFKNLDQPSKQLPPNADSLTILLARALHSEDKILLKECLQVSDSQVMDKSVSCLCAADSLLFLEALVDLLKSKAEFTVVLLPWIRALLLHHASYIMSNRTSVTLLNYLYQLMESRVSGFQSTLQLSGRLDIILSQISAEGGDQEPKGSDSESEDRGGQETNASVETSEDESGDQSD